MIEHFASSSLPKSCNVCVVGAGPAGLAVALALAESGRSVLLIDSGGERPTSETRDLSSGHAIDPARHALSDTSLSRGLGGTSHWWGGRCVPFDDIDFNPRAHVPDARWPISHKDVRPWYEPAAAFFGIGRPIFAAPARPWEEMGDARADELERWTPINNMGSRHKEALANSPNIRVVLGATLTDMVPSEGGHNVAQLTLSGQGKTHTFAPEELVLACGGLETTRLLLVMQQRYAKSWLGGANGPLGRNYMGHISGKICDIVLSDPSSADTLDFFLADGVYARRRFTFTPEAQLREEILNTAFWIDNPPFANPDHRNGVLSLTWLALAIKPIGRFLASEGIRLAHVGPRPHRYSAHARNVLTSPLSTATTMLRIIHSRYVAKPRKPGFLLKNKRGRYALHYHAEHAPNPSSRISLASTCDRFGVPFLDVAFTYTDRDARSVLKSHDLFDRELRKSGLGSLLFYTQSADDRLLHVLTQAQDGYHQIGATRMSTTLETGVIDANCRVHGFENLHVASTAVLPTSGQANPTFVAVALALRLAAHLTQKRSL